MISDQRGNLTFIEGHRHIPFEIKRIYYLDNVPNGGTRGGNAHKKLERLIVAAAGSFDILLDDGNQRTKLRLDRSSVGLYVPPMVWVELEKFSPGSVCLVLASDYYDESDYFRNHDEFLAATRGLTL